MGKLTKLFIFAVCILSIGVVFMFNQNTSDLHSLTVENDSPSSQSFGRGFVKNDPKLLGEIADPDYKINFPRDHYSHKSFDLEWWYLTANLQDKAFTQKDVNQVIEIRRKIANMKHH